MSYSQYQHYYLQSMGIDVYVDRQTPDEPPTEVTAPTKQSATAARPKSKSQFKQTQPQPKQAAQYLSVPVAQLQQSQMFKDVCQLLSIDGHCVSVAPDHKVKLAEIYWAFDATAQKPLFEQQTLVTGPLASLRTSAQKRLVWQLLERFVDKT